MRKHRRWRRQQRREAGHPEPREAIRLALFQRAAYIYLVETSGGRHAWQGKVTVNGRLENISRSVELHGNRNAYLEVLNAVAGWLMEAYPEELALEKIQALRERIPA
jgi:hypothetical protein